MEIDLFFKMIFLNNGGEEVGRTQIFKNALRCSRIYALLVFAAYNISATV